MKKRKSRKKLFESPYHIRRKNLHIHLSKDLKEKYKLNKRAILPNKGDTVKVMRGSFKGKIAKITRVSVKKIKVYLEGITRKNARGKEVLIPFSPSNLLLTDIVLTKDRMKKLNISPQTDKQASLQTQEIKSGE